MLFMIVSLKMRRPNGENEKGEDDTGIVLWWRGDHSLVEALILKEDIPHIIVTPHPSLIFLLLYSFTFHPLFSGCHGFQTKAPHSRFPVKSSGQHLSWLDLELTMCMCLHSIPSLLLAKQYIGNDKNKSTTEILHTVVQYKYKHYENELFFLFSSHSISFSIQNVRGCFDNQEFIFPLLGYEVLISMPDIYHNCVTVFKTVP